MHQEQKKVVAVKFIRVAWDEAPQRGIWRVKGSKHEGIHYVRDMYDPPLDSSHVLRGRGLDIAHSELEAEIEMLLEKGWTMEGGVTYINPDKVASSSVSGGAGWSHLVQKMVKYETATEQQQQQQQQSLGIRR